MCVKYLNILFFMCISLFLNESCASGLVQFRNNSVVVNEYAFKTINLITLVEWMDFVDRGIASNNQEKSLEKNLVASNVVVKNGTISHVQLLDTLPSLEARKNNEVADEILKSSLFVYNTKCVPRGISGEHCEAILSDINLPKDSLLNKDCQKILNERHYGHYPLRRLLPRHYKDGFYKMFTDVLPQPLLISRALAENSVNYEEKLLGDHERNLALVQWAEFVANDLSKPVVTTMSSGYPIECCNIQNYRLSPRYHHPACEPLISKDDTNKYGRDTCLNYVRSALGVGNKCTFAAPDQLNQATVKLDLSQLYGFTKKSQERVRLYKYGLLKSTNAEKWKEALLPMADEDDSNLFCVQSRDDVANSACFMAGDSRVNNNPYAILIYTIMMRNHNRIAKELNIHYPDWKDEQLFQKAKSINKNIYQKIVFNEWLPIILGSAMTNEINKGTKNPSSYNSSGETFHQLSNEYAVAASRFYLSMMPNELIETNAEFLNDNRSKKYLFTLQNEIYSPSIEYTSNKLDKILYSILMQPAMKMDANYVESLTFNLEKNQRPKHSDLLALDIQRGRDHGLQPYIKYLEICNNVKINDWEGLQKFILPDNLNKLKTIYTSWNDIDLIVGGISEISVKNITVGPTFQCIIGEQFEKLRQQHQKEMDEDDSNLTKWKQITATDLLCLNSNLKQLPVNIFQIPSKTKNPMIDCSHRRNILH